MRKISFALFICFSILLSACAPTQQDANINREHETAEPSQPEATAEVTATTEPTPVNEIYFTLLYTNDEHGWMEGTSEGSGAANLFALWQKKYGCDDITPCLILSGGDNWTGAAISTWFAGRSMVEVMNAMGYNGGAVGNHEFDFGLDGLAANAAAMNFPLLSANTRYRETGETPTDLGILPYVVIDWYGIKVGITGLTTLQTYITTKPDVIETLEFIDYMDALNEVIPQMKADGAQILLVPGHMCRNELATIRTKAEEMGIKFLGGGHCHEEFSSTEGNMPILGGGSYLQAYGYAEFSFSYADGTLALLSQGTELNYFEQADEAIQNLVDEWQAEADIVLTQVVGYTKYMVPKNSDRLRDWIVETWLWAYPTADIALTNTGGIRDNINAGEITLGDVISVLPFDNNIIELHLTGQDLIDILFSHRNHTAIAGMEYTGGEWILTATGEPLDPAAIYVVLINDFMYAGGDNYNFKAFDPDGYDTSLHYRQPLVDWLEAHPSNEAEPIDALIDELIE